MYRSGRGKKIAVYAVMGLFLFTGASYAELTNLDLPDRKGVKVADNVTLHGAMKAAESVDTNIFLRNTDRRIDAITVLSPSAGIEVPFHNGSVSADYEMDIFVYADNETENHIDHSLRGEAEMRLTDLCKVTARDIFRMYTDRASNENSLRLKEKTNDLRFGIEGNFNRLMLDAGYTNRLETYDSTDTFLGNLTYEDKNRDINIIDTSVSYRFWPKTAAVLENDIGFINYYNSSQVPDSFFDEVLFGFKGAWFPRANINYRAGFKYQHYDDSQVITDKSYIGPVMKGGFDYNPTASDILVFEFDREIYESLYRNNNYYTANAFGLKWRHSFTPKIYTNLYGSYQLHLYPSESTENGETGKRYDNYFQAGASVKYDLRKWVSLEAKYEVSDRISRFDIYNYVDHAITVSGTVGF